MMYGAKARLAHAIVCVCFRVCMCVYDRVGTSSKPYINTQFYIREIAERGKKRKAIEPYSAIGKEGDVSLSVSSRCNEESLYMSSRHWDDLRHHHTPSGPLVKNFGIDLTTGGTTKIQCCCPFASLYLIYVNTIFFRDFLRCFLTMDVGNVCFYIFV